MKGLQIRKKHKRTLFQIVQIGAGANGSHFFRNVLQDIATYRSSNNNSFFVDYKLVDEDRVERKNMRNQLFTEEDIGEYKCVALVDRYSVHYGISVTPISHYVTDLDMLIRLFDKEHIGERDDVQIIPVLIGMVDNNKTRQLLDTFFYSNFISNLIYIDAGVEGVTVIFNPENELTVEEAEDIEASGFGGQIVVGYKYNNQVILEPVGRVFSNILSDENTAFPGQSCGEAIINNPQRCQTNKFAAQLANGIINNLFHNGAIYSHVIDFNAQYGGSKVRFVNKDIIERYNQVFFV